MANMKYLLILGDGMADEPISELGGRTPLEVAKKPNMDRIAREGRCGMMKTIPESREPGSDVANMSILGYDLEKYYIGRGALEAVSMDISFGPLDLAYRCNLVTIEDGKMKDFTAGHISSEEGKQLFVTLQERLKDFGVKLYPGVSYRGVLMLPNAKGSVTKAPHDIVDELIESYLPNGEDAAELQRYMIISCDVFTNHPVNRARISAGESPANMIWPWSSGKNPKIPQFSEMFDKNGAIISAVDLLIGIARCAGMKVVKVPGATGYLDTDYMSKAKAAVDILEGDVDFVYMHVEATDEAGHLGSIKEKIKAIERLDEAIGYVLDHFDGCVILTPDHPTPIAKRTHTRDPVPFAVLGLSGHDDVSVYTEKEIAAKGSYGTIISTNLLKMIFFGEQIISTQA
jgi:2,3-bisphosphoglycerate-independent phosphoglycerate mutase